MVDDLKKPFANNSFAARGLYNNRKLYKDASYPNHPSYPKPLDLWYTQEHYGRMEPNKNALIVNETELEHIESTKDDEIFALNFVADAFEDLRNYMKKAVAQNKLTEGSPYFDLQPSVGWSSCNREYDEYMDDIYKAFFEGFMKNKKRDEKLVSFGSFLRLFSEFVSRITPSFVFSQTAFALSQYSSPLTSGLMLEFEISDHGNDKIKYEDFIEDKNFYFFLKAAQLHGFVVDKNAPWRIIADIGSVAMQRYMEAHQITLDNVFQVSYHHIYQIDIEVMKQYLIQIYNLYATDRPEVRIYKPSTTINNAITKTAYKRVLIDFIDEIEFDEMYWLKYYTFVRARELGRDWRQVTFDRLIKTSRQLLKYENYMKALDYLNRRLRGPQPKFLSLTTEPRRAKIDLDEIINKTFDQPYSLF